MDCLRGRQSKQGLFRRQSLCDPKHRVLWNDRLVCRSFTKVQLVAFCPWMLPWRLRIRGCPAGRLAVVAPLRYGFLRAFCCNATRPPGVVFMWPKRNSDLATHELEAHRSPENGNELTNTKYDSSCQHGEFGGRSGSAAGVVSGMQAVTAVSSVGGCHAGFSRNRRKEFAI